MPSLPALSRHSPSELNIKSLGDQSIFVKGAVNGVIQEVLLATVLTAAMILVFLGNWRSTLIIAISIPVSILSSVIVLGAIGQTINIMTLGGLALAVGILVDNATVTIENIERHLEEGRGLKDAILEGAQQIGTPLLVSTLCICVVFLPMFFLGGVARYLFVPLAEAVVFAMIASYIGLVPWFATLAMYLLKAKQHVAGPSAQSPGAVPTGIRERLREISAPLSESVDGPDRPSGSSSVVCFWRLRFDLRFSAVARPGLLPQLR